MTLANKLNIDDEIELARVEERTSKINAYAVLNSSQFDRMKASTFKTLAKIHKILFGDIIRLCR